MAWPQDERWSSMMQRLNSFMMEDMLNQRSKERSMDYLRASGEQATGLEQLRTQNNMMEEENKFRIKAAESPYLIGLSMQAQRARQAGDPSADKLEADIQDEMSRFGSAFTKITTGQTPDITQDDVMTLHKNMTPEQFNNLMTQSGQNIRAIWDMPFKAGTLGVQQGQLDVARRKVALVENKVNPETGEKFDRTQKINLIKDTIGRINYVIQHPEIAANIDPKLPERIPKLAQAIPRLVMLQSKVANDTALTPQEDSYITLINDVTGNSMDAYNQSAGNIAPSLPQPSPMDTATLSTAQPRLPTYDQLNPAQGFETLVAQKKIELLQMAKNMGKMLSDADADAFARAWVKAHAR